MRLAEAARVAAWCHSGHCGEANEHLPALIAGQRSAISARIDGLRELDARLADLERHFGRAGRTLTVLGASAPCCDAAGAVAATAEGGCSCCATTVDGERP